MPYAKSVVGSNIMFCDPVDYVSISVKDNVYVRFTDHNRLHLLQKEAPRCIVLIVRHTICNGVDMFPCVLCNDWKQNPLVLAIRMSVVNGEDLHHVGISMDGIPKGKVLFQLV